MSDGVGKRFKRSTSEEASGENARGQKRASGENARGQQNSRIEQCSHPHVLQSGGELSSTD